MVGYSWLIWISSHKICRNVVRIGARRVQYLEKTTSGRSSGPWRSAWFTVSWPGLNMGHCTTVPSFLLLLQYYNEPLLLHSRKFSFSHVLAKHGLINYIDTKAKCRHPKILTCKGRCLSEFIDWRQGQSFSFFRPALWTVAPLTFSLVQLLPSPQCD